MYRNVMSPKTARRLGACAYNITKTRHHARLSTTSFKSREAPPNFHQEHLERLAWIQKDDLSKLVPVKAKIKQYQAECDRAREFLADLPEALAPLDSLSPIRSLKEHQRDIENSIESLNALRDQKLPNLLANVEDLQTELFPDPGSDQSELAFLEQVGGMTAEERQDKYNSLTMELRALVMDTARKMATDAPVARAREPSASMVQNPFAAVQMNPILTGNSKKSEEVEQMKARDKLKFGLSTEEQFARVLAGATKKEDTLGEEIKKKLKKSTANFGLGGDGETTVTKDDIEKEVKKAVKNELKNELKKELKRELKNKPAATPVTSETADAITQNTPNDEASEAPKPVARSSVVSRLARQQTDDTLAQEPDIPNVELTLTTESEAETPALPKIKDLSVMQAMLEASFKQANSKKP